MSVHKPVLLKEAIDLLNLKPGMTVIDATLGGGGHSAEILRKIRPGGKLIAIDWDQEAVKRFQNKLKSLKLNLKEENISLVQDNFARLGKILDSLKTKKVDGILADLGVSSDQLEGAERGFSFLADGPLDMRMNLADKKTASEIVSSYPERDLARILRDYGGERYAEKIAGAVVKARKNKLVKTTLELVDIIGEAVPENYKHQKLHFATRTFQALRIEVNNELENLKSFLTQAVEALKPGGRIVIISFHSGEDRIVKNFFRENARGCINKPEEIIYGRRGKPKLKIITKKPGIPTEKEIWENPRAGSARLRVAEKV